jgi:hypothetical protein
MADQQIIIAPGMSERIDARHLPMGTPRLLQNIRVRDGARFEKRPGTGLLATTNLPTSAYGSWLTEHRGLVTVGLETVSTRRGMFCYSLTDSETYWTLIGRHGVVVPERRFTISLDDDTSGNHHTCTAINGTLYVAYTDAAETTVTLLAVDPGGMVLRKRTLTTASRPRLVYANSVLYLVYRLTSGGGTSIEVRAVTLTTLALGSATAVATLTASTAHWDAAPIEGGTGWVLAYPTTATNLRVSKLSAVTVSASGNQATMDQPTLIGVAAYEGEHICCAYNEPTQGGGDGQVSVFILNTSTLGTTSNHIISEATPTQAYTHQCGVVRTTTSTFAIVMGGSDADSSPTLLTSFLSHARITSGGTLTGPYSAWNMSPSSKPWTYGAAGERQVLIWANSYNDTSDQYWIGTGAHYVLELEPNGATGGGVNLAAFSYEHIAGYGENDIQSHLPEVASFGSGQRAALLPWNDPGNYSGLDVAVFRSSLASESLRWASRHCLSSANALHISGGCLYDVSESSLEDNAASYYSPENGFPYAPAISLTSANGGNLTDGESYTYVAVYRWLDSAGRVHRSAPSNTAIHNVSSPSKTTTVRVATLAATGKVGSISGAPVGEVYRSWNGGPFYYVGDTGTVENDALSITVNDALSDTLAEGGRTLYTDLGEETYPPSGARLICVGGNRMFAVGWRENVVQVSKLFIPTAPWEFCDDDAFRVFVPEAITGIAYLDGALCIFSATSIYVVTGDGPDDQGNGSFSDPRRLPAPVGCEDARSLVETPLGLMYKGAGTIWLLPRGFGPPQPVGDDVQGQLATYPYVLSAVMCANGDDEAAHFLVGNADPPTATRVLVYDTRLQAWSVDNFTSNPGAAGNVDGKWTWALTSWTENVSALRQLDTTSQSDFSGGALWIESRIGFGDFRPFGPLGWGRLRKLQIHGEAVAQCRLNLTVVSMSGTGDSLTESYSKGLVAGEFYAEHMPKHEQGGAWRFDIYDSESGLHNSGLAIHSVAIQFQAEEGLRRLSEAEKF